MSLNITSKTVADVASTVRRQFGDESGVQITDADIIRWVDEGQRAIASKNKVLRGKAAINAVDNQADYTLPEVDIISIESIHWNGVPLAALPYTEVEAYIKGFPEQTTGTGTPVAWYEWGGVVTFFPVPIGVTPGVITLLYVRAPAAPVLLSDALALPDKYFNSLVQYVLSQAYEMDEDWEASNFKTEQMGSALDFMADDERSTSGMTYPTIQVTVEY